MSRSRAAAGTVVDRVVRLTGRRQVVRAARFVLNRARLDAPNAMATNGESLLQAALLDACPIDGPLCVFDVGANEGEWSRSILQQADSRRPDVTLAVHCFEPSSFTVERLRSNLRDDGRVIVNQLALSDRPGTADLHLDGDGAGSNSLHERPGKVAASEAVRLSTVDEYCLEQGVADVDLLKIDTEGHDLAVLEGAARMLGQGLIGVVQFEYNHRWIEARRFLRDAFDLLEPLGYRLGKVTPIGIEIYPHGWDWELESFVEGNYVAFNREAEHCLPPTISWWKDS